MRIARWLTDRVLVYRNALAAFLPDATELRYDICSFLAR
jgi:hypothetical protein